MRPDFGRIRRDEDGCVADDADLALGGIGAKGRPLPIEEELPEAVHRDLGRERLLDCGQRHGIAAKQIRRPIDEARAAQRFADRHERGVAFEPVRFRRGVRFEFLLQAGGLPAAKRIPRRAKQRFLERRDALVIDAIVGETLTRPEGPRHEAIAFQKFRAEQVDVPGEGRERLVGRVAGTGGAERQHLPPALPHGGKRLDPAVGGGAEVADAERSGQAGRVKENSGGSAE